MHVRVAHENQMNNALVFGFELTSEGFRMKPISSQNTTGGTAETSGLQS